MLPVAVHGVETAGIDGDDLMMRVYAVMARKERELIERAYTGGVCSRQGARGGARRGSGVSAVRGTVCGCGGQEASGGG